jgi:hypothetical protein
MKYSKKEFEVEELILKKINNLPDEKKRNLPKLYFSQRTSMIGSLILSYEGMTLEEYLNTNG